MWLSAATLAMTIGMAATASAPARFLALGDSYTVGEGVAEPGRWPNQLAAALRRDGVALEDPRIVARTGWTTDELDAAIERTALQPPYDLVTLLIGVNNQYRGRDLDNYRAEFRGLLRRAAGFAGGDARRVVVVSIPDWGVTRFARENGRDAAQVAREIDVYNAANEAITRASGAHYADVTALSRAHADLLADDGLHPSAAMYTRWLTTIVPAAREALSSR